MKLQSVIGAAVLAAGYLTAFGESTAHARTATLCRTNPPPPPECTGRNLVGYRAGLGQGTSLVDQIWESNTVGEDPNKWSIVIDRVTDTIPATVAAVKESTWGQYLQCRTQGLLDASVCRLNEIDPIPGCQLDGVDWGKMSAALYCELSVALNGLGDVSPWFVRPPPGMCADGFQTYCEDVYRYVATNATDPLSSGVVELLASRDMSVQPVPACAPYTVDNFTQTFEDSVYIDCSYEIPEPL